jgi:RNA polymerase sigma-70 factor (ECF subfamily)
MRHDVELLIEELYRSRYANFREALAPIVGDRDRAHDVVQEAFAQALRKRGELRKIESLPAWVWRIAYRIALNERLSPGAVGELPDDLTILEADQHPDLASALRTLPPQRRLVLFLRYYADFSYAEIAEALDIRQGTVSATISQAHAALLDRMMTKEEVAP